MQSAVKTTLLERGGEGTTWSEGKHCARKQQLFYVTESATLTETPFEDSRQQNIRHTHTLGRTPLYQRSARHTELYLQNTQQTNIHAISGIRTCHCRNQVAATYT